MPLKKGNRIIYAEPIVNMTRKAPRDLLLKRNKARITRVHKPNRLGTSRYNVEFKKPNGTYHFRSKVTNTLLMKQAGGAIERREGMTHAYFTFGRFQPPHSGHASLVKAVYDAATAGGGDGYIFATSSQNKEKYLKGKKHLAMVSTGAYDSCKDNENPLSIDQKIHFLELMNPYPGLTFVNTTECGCPNLFDVLGKLKDAGYTELTMIVGQDRVATFTRLLAAEGTEVEVVGTGEKRNSKGPLSGALRTVSGTKVREAAIAGDVEVFTRATLMGKMTQEDVIELMNLIRTQLCYGPLGAEAE